VLRDALREDALPVGVPQAEQKRPFTGVSVPQDVQKGMKIFPLQSTAPL
jgi:hypothetical protein